MNVLRTSAYSISGRREINEDSYIIFEPEAGLGLYAVADGMGGAASGEIASSLAIRTITRYIHEKFRMYKNASVDDTLRMMTGVYDLIQLSISDAVSKDNSLEGMGTTLVLLLNIRDKWYWANLGDSRLYLIYRNKIQLLTKDHTLVQDYIDKNKTPPDEGVAKNYSGYLTKALDGSDNKPDVGYLENMDDDSISKSCFLLCSDGMITNNNEDDEAFMSIIDDYSNLEEAARKLIAYSYKTGSSDNITVVLVKGSDYKPSPAFIRKGKKLLRSNNKYTGSKSKYLLPVGLSAMGLLIGVLGLLLVLLTPASPGTSYSESTRVQPAIRIPAKPISQTDRNVEILEIDWNPFDQKKFELPVRNSTMLTWNVPDDSLRVINYSIYIYEDGLTIDSAVIGPGNSAIRFGSFNNLEAGRNYEAKISALLDNELTIQGNSVSFIYK